MIKIASLCPSNTELLDFMGLTSNLIAVDDNSDYPPAINKLARLGPDLNIDIDTLEALEPDLIVASLTVPGMEKNITRLSERGLPYIILNPSSFENIGENIIKVGTAINNETLAKNAYHHYQTLLEECRNEALQIQEKTKVYWEWWPRPVFTPGGTNWLTELSELVGAENVFADVPIDSVETDWEDVRKRNPDYIFLNWVGVEKEKIKPELLNKRPEWITMKALQENRVIVLGDAPFCRPSPRLLLGIKQVRSLLHPNVFSDYDEVNSERWLYGNA